MRRFLRAWIATLSACALAACSVLTDTSDLTGGTRAAADATADVSTEAHVDGDAPSNDASGDGAVIDASTSDAADAALPCPPGAMVLCDTFERSTLLGPWERQSINGGGTLTIVSEGSRSLLRATMPPPPTVATQIEAFIAKDFGLDATACFYDFDVRYTKLPTTDPVEFAAIYWGHTAGAYEAVFLALRPSKITVTEESSAGGYVFSDVVIAAGGWHHVSIEAHVAGQLIVKVDTVTVLSKALALFVKAGQPSVVAGISYAATPSTALDVDMDNVVFRAVP
ncbi:MAG: hypothetical protein JWM74_3857 [Myxococcaceae bacterium]|nr:hypothetical protein [Myxococcaceae bacterium]